MLDSNYCSAVVAVDRYRLNDNVLNPVMLSYHDVHLFVDMYVMKVD